MATSKVSQILSYVPYSFISIHKKLLGNNGSILDLGCGDGIFLKSILENSNRKITGVDIFEKSLLQAKKVGIYTEFIQGDVITVCKNLLKQKKKYDIVFCSEIIEHLDRKKGEELLGLIEKLARKMVIVTTPKGYLEQEHSYVESNPHQHHESGWELEDFTKRGYTVHGLGSSLVWSQHGIGRSKNKLVSSFASILSLALSPLAYYRPNYSAGILAIKKV